MTNEIQRDLVKVSREIGREYGARDGARTAQGCLRSASGDIAAMMHDDEVTIPPVEPPVDPPVEPPVGTDPPVEPEPPVDVDPPPPVDPPDPDDWVGETSVFKPGGAYDWLSDLYVNLLAEQGVTPYPPKDKYVDTRAYFVNNIDSKDTFELTQLNGLRILGNSQKGMGSDTLLWGAIRGYGCFNDDGEWVEDVEVVRSGDFDKEREGHAFYCALFGSSRWRNIRTRQNLGQSGQFTFRPNTTRLSVDGSVRPSPKPEHYNSSGQLDPKKYGAYLSQTSWWKALQAYQAQQTVRFENWESIDDSCGGTKAARSSNPFSWFNPGQQLELIGMKIKCNLARPFASSSTGKGSYRSRGGPMTWKSYNTMVPNLLVEGLEVNVSRPDREEFRCHGVVKGLIDKPTLIRNNGDSLPRISIYDNCVGPIIVNADGDVEVTTHSAKKESQHKLLATKRLKKGESFSWTK